MARRKTSPVETVVFLPDCLEQVKAVAMRGVSDEEMAAVFGISKKLIKKWKDFYPNFEKAIEEGRTLADIEVVEALHKKAVGYEYDTDIVVKTRQGSDIHTVTKVVEPDTSAIKYWLSNRQPKHWSERQQVNVGGQKGTPPISMQTETKLQVMSSILNLIQPKPDEDV